MTQTQQFKEFTLDELTEKLCENKKTLIIYHVRSDADAVGSAFALRELFRQMNIPSYCACGDEIPERLRFIVDGVQGSVLLEDGLCIDYERIISVDSAAPSQLGALFTRLHKDIDIMIDHHASSSVYADYYVDPNAAATGEIIYEVAKKLLKAGHIEAIPQRVINCVYAAISSDTGGFRYSNATPKTLRIAAELLERGIDGADINRRLFELKSPQQLVAEREGLKNLAIYMGGRVAVTTITYAKRQELGLSSDDLGTLIDIPRSVSGAEVAVALREEGDGSYRASMRSASDIDVSKICARFGGGGHKKASGCTVDGNSLDNALNKLLEEIKVFL